MAETQIYQESHSHYQDPPPSVLPPRPALPGSGDDVLHVNIPAGKTFSRYDLRIEGNPVGGLAHVTSAPSAGATGGQDIKVHWSYAPFGKIAYTLTAFAVDQGASTGTTLVVNVGDASWPQRSLDAIRQHNAVQLHARGPDAITFFNALRHARGLPPAVPAPLPGANQVLGFDDVTVADIVAITAILAAVAIVALIVIAVICVVAIQYHYHVDVKLVSHGPLPWDQELVIGLDPR
jgi:hypothetical protein